MYSPQPAGEKAPSRPFSFEQLVGAAGQWQRNIDAERFGGFQIDVEFNLGRLLNRQIGGLVAFENSAGLDPRQAI